MTFTRFWRVHEFRVKWIVALGETTHRKDLLRRALRQRTDRTSSSSLRALPRWTFTCNLRKAWGPKMRFTDARARVPRREHRLRRRGCRHATAVLRRTASGALPIQFSQPGPIAHSTG